MPTVAAVMDEYLRTDFPVINAELDEARDECEVRITSPSGRDLTWTEYHAEMTRLTGTGYRVSLMKSLREVGTWKLELVTPDGDTIATSKFAVVAQREVPDPADAPVVWIPPTLAAHSQSTPLP